MKRHHWWVPCAVVASILIGDGAAAQSLKTTLFSENFDGLAGSLGASVNERQGFPVVTRVATDPDSAPIPDAFTHTGPAGWTINNGLSSYQGVSTVGNVGVPGQGVADYGVDEWEGWSFADMNFWYEKDDQDRSAFTNASGTIAVVDPDEYFDLDPADGETGGPSNPSHGGFYNSSLVTPSIATPAGNIYTLSFDSSWRDESFDDSHPIEAFNDLNNQAVEVVAVFDNGVRQTRTAWDSAGPANPGDPIPATFKDDTPNEHLSLNFGVPAGATSVRFEFNIANAGNDWWWAIDNLEVTNLSAGGAQVWAEDFEGLSLDPSVNERRSLIASKVTAANDDADTSSRPDSFTHAAPAGWGVDNTTTPGIGDDNVGVYEWEGWSFATPEFWTFADTQGREAFTKGTGVVAIADGDEWDDLGDPESQGELNTLLETPEVALPTLVPGQEFAVKFDSSWRAEDAQTAVLTVSLDGGAPTELLRWESDNASAFFHDDNTNESVFLTFDAAGASTAQFAFQYVGTDDWWWAIDNVQVGIVPEPAAGVLLAVALLAPVVRRRG